MKGNVPQFSSAWSPELKFGFANVRVPDDHKTGNVHRPGLNWWYALAFFVLKSHSEERTRDFTVVGGNPLTREAFVQSIRDSHAPSALVYVHGFATNFDQALFGLAQIKWDTGYPGIPIVFSWPSRGDRNVFSYNYDRECAEDSDDAFLEVLRVFEH
jgi:esterase/lipase superfamily enzyme